MSSAHDLAKVLKDLDRRIKYLERRLLVTGRPDEILFSLAGAVISDASNHYDLRGASQVVGASLVVPTAPTEDSVVTVFVETLVASGATGTSEWQSETVGTVTLPAGEKTARTVFPTNYHLGVGENRLYVQATTIGAGFASVTMHVQVS